MPSDDVAYMKRALTLAKKGIGKTSPNPAVGCVIVKDGVIVGEGWHRKAGGPHAEVYALAMAGPAARGADVFVTLEPCSHTGRTPPCCDALIAAGVRRVTAGMQDPNPLVSGSGLKALRQAGIAVDGPLLEEECRAVNVPFITAMTTGRPYVTYKYAMTLDGGIATAGGDSRWISCEKSRTAVHRMRARTDAIMVGVDTVTADDPQLTVRHVRGRDPLRVIVDSRLRTPAGAAVLSGGLSAGTVIATTEAAPERHAPYLSQGVRILVCSEADGHVDIDDLLRKLCVMGIRSLLLEGGSRLAGAMLQRGLIDELLIFTAPKLIGGSAIPPFDLQGITAMTQAVRLEFTAVTRSGSDIMISARPERQCSQD